MYPDCWKDIIGMCKDITDSRFQGAIDCNILQFIRLARQKSKKPKSAATVVITYFDDRKAWHRKTQTSVLPGTRAETDMS